MTDFPYAWSNDDQLKLQIRVLEETQHRALRELALGSTTALARVQEIDNQITALRAQITPGEIL